SRRRPAFHPCAAPRLPSWRRRCSRDSAGRPRPARSGRFSGTSPRRGGFRFGGGSPSWPSSSAAGGARLPCLEHRALLAPPPPRFSSLRRAPASILAPALLTGLGGPAAAGVLWTILWYFAEAGAFVFGSGLAIVPFLYGGVVREFHWLSDRQFLDAVAVAMIT